MTPSNFLEQLQWLVVGGNGFNRQVTLPANAIATTGTRATATNSLPADVIVLDADAEDAIVPFQVPLDYDSESDLLDISLLVRHVSGTSNTIQADSVGKANATTDLAAVSAFTPAAATTINAAFDIGLVQANLSGLGLQAGDVVYVNFAVANTAASGVAHVLSGAVTYRSVLVSYADANRGAEVGASTDHLH